MAAYCLLPFMMHYHEFLWSCSSVSICEQCAVGMSRCMCSVHVPVQVQLRFKYSAHSGVYLRLYTWAVCCGHVHVQVHMHVQVHVPVPVHMYVCSSTHLGVYLRLCTWAQLFSLHIVFFRVTSYDFFLFFFFLQFPLVGILVFVACLLVVSKVPFFGIFQVYRVSRPRDLFNSMYCHSEP